MDLISRIFSIRSKRNAKELWVVPEKFSHGPQSKRTVKSDCETKPLQFDLSRKGPLPVFFALVVAILCANLALANSADNYRLVSGDVVTLDSVFSDRQLEVQIDLNGQIRLPDFGSVKVAGLTLDEAEDATEEKIREGGLSEEPRVSMAVLRYAPIIVSGNVERPGRYDFFPGLTVSSAIGLAGGLRLTGMSRVEFDQRRVSLASQLAESRYRIASLVATMRRLEAIARDDSEFEVKIEEGTGIPGLEPKLFSRLIEKEALLFNIDRQVQEELIAGWNNELEVLGERQRLFKERLEVLDLRAAQTRADLEDVLTLKERGLQTSARLANAERAAADSRSRFLEINSLLVEVTGKIAEVEREATRQLSRRRADNLENLSRVGSELELEQINYGRLVEERLLVENIGFQAIDAWPEDMQSISIFSLREGRTAISPAASTPLLPGDQIEVRIVGED
ncbi:MULTISPECIES: polysaccharide biosynthesis/export family protein [unclassified Ruegeria]|uniref:polysaccharide biosynthesis/export family protein n=1 Tax=unclassified Ruegeria TaxID=2625375 RepID=UPI001487E6A3|nr:MULTISPECIES: polysaccharide biosynthesis/export family protein [unclassified Ruegeria]